MELLACFGTCQLETKAERIKPGPVVAQGIGALARHPHDGPEQFGPEDLFTCSCHPRFACERRGSLLALSVRGLRHARDAKAHATAARSSRRTGLLPEVGRTAGAGKAWHVLRNCWATPRC